MNSKAPMKYIVVSGGTAAQDSRTKSFERGVGPAASRASVHAHTPPRRPRSPKPARAHRLVLFLAFSKRNAGVVSGLGKGVTASSIGVLLRAGGWRVTSIKIDPYINIDAGTMSPFEHGEVFVLDDGGEADLDLGNYERFVDRLWTLDHWRITPQDLPERHREGAQGRVPGQDRAGDPACHGRDPGVDRARGADLGGRPARSADVCIIELGGTVGDIESMPFIEALRQFQWRVGSENFCLIHVSLVPVVGAVGEQKNETHAALRAGAALPGLSRAHARLQKQGAPRASRAGQARALLPRHARLHLEPVRRVQHLARPAGDAGAGVEHLAIMRQLRLDFRKLDLDDWAHRADKWDTVTEPVTIAVVGKYTGLGDSYLSVTKALMHSAIASDRKLSIVWVEAGMLEDATQAEDPAAHADAWAKVRSADGVLVPGGFGERGTEGRSSPR